MGTGLFQGGGGGSEILNFKSAFWIFAEKEGVLSFEKIFRGEEILPPWGARPRFFRFHFEPIHFKRSGFILSKVDSFQTKRVHLKEVGSFQTKWIHLKEVGSFQTKRVHLNKVGSFEWSGFISNQVGPFEPSGGATFINDKNSFFDL